MPEGTGILRTTGDGLELVLARELDITPGELWSWVTESDKLAQWIGSWTGDGRVGGVVELTMTAEESREPERVTIIDCDPPKRLQVEMSSEAGTWQLQVDVAPRGERTEVALNQLVEQGDDVRSVGPGWEFYMDRLVAAITGEASAPFEDYFPALVDYYSDLQ